MMRVSLIALIVGVAVGAAAPPAAGAEACRVQFVVVSPDEAVDSPAHIHMPNSHDGWNPTGRVVPRIAPGVYAAALEFPCGAVISYKFTREPGWGSVEKEADGGERSDRQVRVDPSLKEQVVVCVVARWADRPPAEGRSVTLDAAATTQPTTRPSTRSGDIRVHERFESPQLHNERTVLVWLPPGYDADADRRYPVLYMHDGNNVFDAATSFAGVEWGADESAARLIAAGKIEPLIIVAIYNNADRVAEYTPMRDKLRGGGNADGYITFIAETLKPFIDRTYRTRPEREHTGIAGSSLGGLVSLYAAYAYTGVFGRAGVVSPALQFADGAILEYVRHRPPTMPLRIWVDVGTNEGRDATSPAVTPYVQTVRKLVEIMESQGFERGRNFTYLEVEGAQHNEAAWAARLDQMLTFLFPAGGATLE